MDWIVSDIQLDHTWSCQNGSVKAQKPRADFPARIRDMIAKRAGHRCSFPGCDLSTSGPANEIDQSASIGEAAHIFSAAPDGPRGDGGLSHSDRQRVDNGIWLCGNHARRIDKNHGKDFPAPTLTAYRHLHEHRIKLESDGTGRRTGWIHKISLKQVPVFVSPVEIELGKVTVIQGSNGSGKTALCDWLEAISDTASLSKWADIETSKYFSFEVTYFDPLLQNIKIRMLSPEEIEYFINGDPIPFIPNPVRFVRLRDLRPDPFSDRVPKMTDVEFLSKSFSISAAIVRNMLPYVGAQSTSSIFGLRLEQGIDGTVRVRTEIEGSVAGLSLQQLSNSERSRVLIETAAVFARHSAQRVPTVLLLDWAAKSFDANG